MRVSAETLNRAWVGMGWWASGLLLGASVGAWVGWPHHHTTTATTQQYFLVKRSLRSLRRLSPRYNNNGPRFDSRSNRHPGSNVSARQHTADNSASYYTTRNSVGSQQSRTENRPLSSKRKQTRGNPLFFRL